MTIRFVPGSIGLALAALIMSAGAATAVPAASAWAQAGFGPGNTGYNPAEPAINGGTIARLRPGWTAVPQPSTEGCLGPTTPVIADGRMFIVDNDGIGAYDTTTGKLLWRNPDVMSAKIGRTLTVVGDLVITTGWGCFSMSNPSGHLAALDVRTGKLRWHVIQNDAVETVVADRGMLIAYADCNACGSTSVTGYRASDGTRKWSYDEGVTGPVSADGRLLITDAKGSHAIAATTGKVLWRSPVRWSVLAADPAGDRFYAAGPTGALAALSAATGRVGWSAPDAAGPLAADGRRVYPARHGIAAYDATSGRKLWRRAGVPAGRPIRAGGLLYVTGSVLSPVDGATLAPTGYHTSASHVVVVGGRLYSTTPSGTVRTFTP